MNTVFATATYDPRDISRGSGTYYHMSQEIERQGHHVHYVGPVSVSTPWPTRLFRAITIRCGRRYKTYLDPWVARARGKVLTKIIHGIDADLLITNDFGLAAYTVTEIPIVIYTDSMLPRTYAHDVPAESRVANIPLPLVKLFHTTIRRGMSRAQLCVFPSKWTADEAQKYGISSSKIEVIPFGANLEDSGICSASSAKQKLSTQGQLNLLFVGKEWVRKGGKEAVEITAHLRKRGIDAMLHVVGTTPNVGRFYVQEYGLLDKSISEEKALLHQLYSDAHVLLLPSRSEGFGIVALEAAAYGVPVLAYNVEGLVSAVVEGVTGYLFDASEDHGIFVDTIQRWINEPWDYEALSRSAQTYYLEEANWASRITALFDAVEKHMVVKKR